LSPEALVRLPSVAMALTRSAQAPTVSRAVSSYVVANSSEVASSPAMAPSPPSLPVSEVKAIATTWLPAQSASAALS
jgi:hypothetical protein